MAENEEGHRHSTEDRIVDSVIKQKKLGQIFAFGIAPAILALTSLAAVFIGNKNNK